MAYVDGFVLSVKKSKVKEYKKIAQGAGKVWMKYGALQYLECKGDDLNHDAGGMKVWSFPKMAKAKKDEIVFFSFIVYKSRKHRDQVNDKVMEEMMKDPKLKDRKMPFDMKRMAYGGFEPIVQY